jgi:hypothetical protein
MVHGRLGRFQPAALLDAITNAPGNVAHQGEHRALVQPARHSLLRSHLLYAIQRARVFGRGSPLPLRLQQDLDALAGYLISSAASARLDTNSRRARRRSLAHRAGCKQVLWT